MASKDADNADDPQPQTETEICYKIIHSLKDYLIPMDTKMTFIYDAMYDSFISHF